MSWNGVATRPATPGCREAVGDDVEWVILCSEGYTSSLAAAALLDIGLHRATDVVGGYHALAGAGVLAELAGDSLNPAALANAGDGRAPAGYSAVASACSSGRSRSVFSGVHPGGDNTAAQPLATSAT